jgi:FimV-like protein
VEPRYKGGDQYGPTAPNERLWDIAAKVRPDPGIGKEVMMKALFMANRQAFAKSGIERMKVGAMLRVPTLREIADYTGSPAAKQLLEQQANATIPLPSESKGRSDSVFRTEADLMPVPESGARSESGSESGFKPSSQPVQPAADTPVSSVMPPAD